eukprot:396613_1
MAFHRFSTFKPALRNEQNGVPENQQQQNGSGPSQASAQGQRGEADTYGNFHQPAASPPASRYNSNSLPPQPTIPPSSYSGFPQQTYDQGGYSQEPQSDYSQQQSYNQQQQSGNSQSRSNSQQKLPVGYDQSQAERSFYNQQQPAQSNYSQQPVQSNYSQQPDQSNYNQQSAQSNNYSQQPAQSNYSQQPAQSNYSQQPAQSNYSQQPAQSNYSQQPVQPNYSQQPAQSNNYNQQQPGYDQPYQQAPGVQGIQDGVQSMSMKNGVPTQQPYGKQYAQPQQPAELIPPHAIPVDPNVMQMTVDGVAVSANLRLQSRIPLGVVLQPLGVSYGEDIPIVDFGQGPVMRCKECRGYINPYVRWTDNGARWVCSMCGRTNDTPDHYYAALDENGYRVDVLERPELSQGSVEIIAPQEYTVRPPMPPTFVFVIDVSVTSVRSGMLRLLCQTVRETLDSIKGSGARTRIAFITFSSAVHFYSLRPSQSAPQMIVFPDLDDVFLPQPDDLLVTLEESRHLVDALLESLPEMHDSTEDVECALGPAVSAGADILHNLGGKILLFSAGLPSIGEGRLKNREGTQALGGENEYLLLHGASNFYKDKAGSITRSQIGIDVFQFSCSIGAPYVDVATVAQLSKFSGGNSYFYPHFSIEQHGERFSAELANNLTRPVAWEAVMRVRVSSGIRIRNYRGNFVMRGRDLLAIPTVDCDQAFSFDLCHEGEVIRSGTLVHVQAALLYTNCDGERRIRIHTLVAPSIPSLPELYGRVNAVAISTVVAKHAIEVSLESNLRKCREQIQNTFIALLRSYRGSGDGSTYHSLDKLEHYPESLRLLPSFCLGLLKCTAFRDGTDVPPDVRSSAFNVFSGASSRYVDLMLRPRLFNLETVLSGKVGCVDASGICTLPEEMPPSIESCSSGGVALVDNGSACVMRVGQGCPPRFLTEVLGVEELIGVQCSELRIRPPSETDSPDCIRARVANIIGTLRVDYAGRYPDIRITIEGDSTEQIFYDLLTDDRTSSVMAKDEFLQFIVRNTGL